MLDDIAPNLIEAYKEALVEPTKNDVISSLNDGSNLSEDRIRTAKRCIEMELRSPSDVGQEDDARPGAATEIKCVDFLKTDRTETTEIVLQNVRVNRKSSSKTQIKDEFWKNNPDTGIILTSSELYGVSSEFDGVVVQEGSEARVSEVWEAKKTISPNTLHDAFFKKISAVSALAEEDGSILVYPHGTALIRKPLQFGVFGFELQSVEKAANQLTTIACQEMLAKDFQIVERAVDTGMVQVEMERIISKLAKLRSFHLENGDDFSITVVVLDTD